MKPLLLLVLALTLPLSAEEVTPTETTKGCVMVFCGFEGGGVTKFFVKVADSEYDDPDTGEHQILGFDPMNKHFTRDGKLIFERVHEKDFIQSGRAGRKDGQPCMFRCPSW